MRNLIHTVLISLCILIGTNIKSTIAQNNVNAVNYRVVAVKNGQPEITSESNTIQLKNPLSVFVPNAFSPNGDGLNDTFGATGEGMVAYNLQIFNRWGNLIFESNDPKVQWDGKYNNSLSEAGIYVYQLHVVSGTSTKNKIHTTGSVLLIAS
jgi:gliding motility-associated-like protein